MARLILAAALALALVPAAAAAGGDVVAYETEAAFEDAAFEVQLAIENRGLVVDHVSHVGEMLNRTAADVGASGQVFAAANVYLFCSAVLSRSMMEADPANIAHCPYGVFVAESAAAPGKVTIGYRRMPEGAMQEVEALLDAIAREAAGLD